MAKVFTDLMELHRTYTRPVTGERYVKKKADRDKEADRLGEPKDPDRVIALTAFRANMFISCDADSPADCVSGHLSVEITKAFARQAFSEYATPFEKARSVLCTQAAVLSNDALESGGSRQWFKPIVVDRGDLDVQVVGHSGVVIGSDLVIPATEARAGDPVGALTRGIPFYVVPLATTEPDGWRSLGVTDVTYKVMTKADGQVISLRQIGSRSLESANWVIDLVVAPAALALAKSGTRMALSLMERLPVRPAPKVLAGATKELAKDIELSAARSAGTTMTGMAVSTRGVLPVEYLGRRTVIMGEDMAAMKGALGRSSSVSGFHDVVIHGNSRGFEFLAKIKADGTEIWQQVSVRDVANAVRSRLAPGDKIRLLACDVGIPGGPAQQLANELGTTVWATDTTVSAAATTTNAGRKVFVPADGGKFRAFDPQGR